MEGGGSSKVLRDGSFVMQTVVRALLAGGVEEDKRKRLVCGLANARVLVFLCILVYPA